MSKQLFDIFSRKKEIIREESKIKIIIDYREKNSLVASELVKLGFEIEFQQLPVGDYIANGAIVERKTFSDFISSMISRHLISQLQELQQYEDKILIIEGMEGEQLYEDKKSEGMNANAIRGFLLSIVLKFRVPIIFSKNSEDTAKFISVLAKKKEKSDLPLNVSKRNLSKKERMQFILESFQGIGPKTAKKLLKEHKTLKNIFNLSQEELEKEIGKKSEGIKIVEEEY